MEAHLPSLSVESRLEIIRHLDVCIDLLDNRVGKLTLADLQIKSAISVVRSELALALQQSAPPFPRGAARPSS
ncbi:MAG TPA: hypothetical protein VG734_22080 [Lacunisphaera sp.]|nr:hypothetical protein [Lacunisphaera sp.]